MYMNYMYITYVMIYIFKSILNGLKAFQSSEAPGTLWPSWARGSSAEHAGRTLRAAPPGLGQELHRIVLQQKTLTFIKLLVTLLLFIITLLLYYYLCITIYFIGLYQMNQEEVNVFDVKAHFQSTASESEGTAATPAPPGLTRAVR